MKIFYIDDERTNLLLFKALIEEDEIIQCEVFINFSDLKAEMDGGNVPDVLITDIKMPELTGFDVVSIMAQDYPNLPTAYCTAFASLDQAFNNNDVKNTHELKRPCYIKPVKLNISEFARNVLNQAS